DSAAQRIIPERPRGFLLDIRPAVADVLARRIAQRRQLPTLTRQLTPAPQLPPAVAQQRKPARVTRWRQTPQMQLVVLEDHGLALRFGMESVSCRRYDQSNE